MKKITLAWLILIPLFSVTFYLLRVPVASDALPAPHYSTDIFETALPLVKSFIFKDITLEAGITLSHTQRSEGLLGLHDSLGAGACAFDYNQDGWIDLLTLNGSGVTHFYGKPQWWQQHTSSLSLYKNNQGKGFIDVTQESGLITSGWSMGCNTGDLDNDGDWDIVISHYGDNQLWRNNGDQTFSHLKEAFNSQQAAWSTGISFADVNRDGLLDIYITNYIDFVTNQLTFEKHSGFADKLPKSFDATLYSGQQNQLLINQGNLNFSDQTNAYGVGNSQGRGLSSQWVDLNQDQYPDLMIFNDKDSQNKVYLNHQGKKFSDITLQSGLGFTGRMSDGLIQDFNQDGSIDILTTTDRSNYLALYRSADDQAMRFKDVSQTVQLRQQVNASFVHWGASAADINLDGWVDMVIANGHRVPDRDAALIPEGQKNTVLLNDKGHKFIAVEDLLSPATHNSFSSRCVTNLDFNNDGAMDLYITHNNGLGQLLKNTVQDRAWIGFHLDAEPASKLGADILVEYQERVILTKMHTSNFLCSHEPRWVIGLGQYQQPDHIDKITIRWNTGKTSDFFNVPINTYHVFSDHSSQVKPLTVSPQTDLDSVLWVKNPDHKLTVIQWLIEQNKAALIAQALRELSKHPDRLVRLKALELSQLLPQTQRIGFIQNALNDADMAIVLAAIQYAEKAEDERLTRWLLKKLESNNGQIVCATGHAFQHFFDEEEAMVIHKYRALNPLIRAARTHQSIDARICAITALGSSEQYRALMPLLELTSHDNQSIRAAAVTALGLLKQKAAIDSLQALFLDAQETPTVREQALIAIVKITPDYPSQSLLERALRESQENSTVEAYKKVIHSLDMPEKSHVVIVIHQTLIAFIREHAPLFSDSNQTNKVVHLETKASDISDRDTYIQALNTMKGQDYQTACEHIFSVNHALKVQAIESFQGCLPQDTLTRTVPMIIAWAFQQKQAEFYSDLVKIVSGRKERWARDWIMQQIKESAMDPSQRLQLINSLAQELSSGIINQLNTLYSQVEQPSIKSSLARVLIRHQQPLIKEDLLEEMKIAIADGEEDIFMIYAQALMETAPDSVLNALIDSR